MAEAAPSSAAGSSGTSAPPTVGQGESSVSSVVEKAAVSESGKATIKPIPPAQKDAEVNRAKKRPSLPGVMSRDPEPLFETVRRDAKGRFSGSDNRDTLEREILGDPDDTGGAPGEVKAEVAVKPPLPDGQQTVQKIKLGGKEYDTPEAADQAHKSLQGMFKNLNDTVKTVTEERDYGYKAAQAWQDEANRLRARNAELEKSLKGGRSGEGDGNVQAAPSGEADDIAANIDYEAFEAIALNGGLQRAGRFLADQILKMVSDKVVPSHVKKLQDMIEPINSDRQMSARAESADRLIKQVGSLKTHDGKEAFPELKDAETLHEIGKMWSESGFPVEIALTQQGLMQAVAYYRMMKGYPTKDDVNSIASIAGEQPANTAPAASVSADGAAGVAPANKGRANVSPETARLLSAMKKSEIVDPLLGFARNRRK